MATTVESLLASILTILVAYGLKRWFSDEVLVLDLEFPSEIRPDFEFSGTVKDQDLDFKANMLIHNYDPATGRSLGSSRVTDPAEVKMIVERARVAQKEYKNTTFQQRRAILSTLLDFIVRHQSELCQLSCLDSGKTIIDAGFGEILTTCEKLRWTIENGEQVLKNDYRSTGLVMITKKTFVEYIPVGVMGVIVSWNYPVHNVLGPLISSLMAGNACIVKCSEHVAWTTTFLSKLIAKTLEIHGLSTDLVQLINGYASTGQAVVTNSDKVIFIGSPGVGKAIMKQASETLTPVVLELGGKDCAVVFRDADVGQFADQACRLAYQNSGQNCAGLERVIIEESAAPEFLASVTAVASKMRIGPPLLEEVDMGAMVMPEQLKIVEELIDDAVAKGAKVLTGGKRYIHPKYPKGQYFLPTIISNLDSSMRIAHEEVFGPVMLIFTFKDEEEAIQLANMSKFGLGSGVFSLDIIKAKRVASQLKVGMSNINAFGVNYLCQGLPFGGVGISGIDCFSGIEGLRGQCIARACTEDRLSFLRTSIPSPLSYPLKKSSAEFQQSTVNLIYGGVERKLGGIFKLATSK